MNPLSRPKKIAVLIRVFDRLEDLDINLSIIKDTWRANDYDLFVVSNGLADGFPLPETVISKCKNTLQLPNNAGHMRGSHQLLQEGMKMIPLADYEFLVILEADTWMYGDRMIEKYSQKLVEKNAVWASALWCDRYFSLAVDFALLSSPFIQKNTAVFDFEDFPELIACNYLIDGKFSYIPIRENMDVMIPGYLKTYPYAPTGRFYSFPKSQMVTHHIESIPGGMLTKKKRFNVLAKTAYFPLETPFPFFSRCSIRCAHFIEKLLPRRTWYTRRKKKIV